MSNMSHELRVMNGSTAMSLENLSSLMYSMDSKTERSFISAQEILGSLEHLAALHNEATVSRLDDRNMLFHIPQLLSETHRLQRSSEEFDQRQNHRWEIVMSLLRSMQPHPKMSQDTETTHLVTPLGQSRARNARHRRNRLRVSFYFATLETYAIAERRMVVDPDTHTVAESESHEGWGFIATLNLGFLRRQLAAEYLKKSNLRNFHFNIRHVCLSDAPLFELVRQGSVEAVNAMLVRNQGSIFDVDVLNSAGLLHVGFSDVSLHLIFSTANFFRLLQSRAVCLWSDTC